MNNEIKEILDKLGEKSSIYKFQINKGTSFNTDEYEASILLDYITNLQAENEKLKNELEQQNIETGLEIERLNKEIGILKLNSQHLVKYNDELENSIKKIENIYQSLCFSAPENNYIFIEQLGEVLQELGDSSNGQ